MLHRDVEFFFDNPILEDYNHLHTHPGEETH